MDYFRNIDWGDLAIKIGAAILIVVVTWILATLAKKGVAALSKRIPALNRPGQNEGESLGNSLGSIVSMIIWLLGLVALLGVFQLNGVLSPVTSMLDKALSYVPNIIGAVFIFVIGLMIAKVVRSLIQTSLQTVHVDQWFGKAKSGVDRASDRFEGHGRGLRHDSTTATSVQPRVEPPTHGASGDPNHPLAGGDSNLGGENGQSRWAPEDDFGNSTHIQGVVPGQGGMGHSAQDPSRGFESGQGYGQGQDFGNSQDFGQGQDFASGQGYEAPVQSQQGHNQPLHQPTPPVMGQQSGQYQSQSFGSGQPSDQGGFAGAQHQPSAPQHQPSAPQHQPSADRSAQQNYGGAQPASQKQSLPRSGNKFADTIANVVFAIIMIVVAISALQVLGIAAISEPAQHMLNIVFNAIPNIIAAGILLVLGVFIARFVAQFAEQLLDGFNLDRSLTETGVLPAGKSVTPAISKIIEVAIVLFFAVMATNLLGFPQITHILNEILTIGGHVLFGGAIVVAGFFIANLIPRFVSGTPGVVLKWVTTVLFLAIGLKYMGLADSIINMAFGALVIGAAAAAALAFGLGGRDAAARQLKKIEDGEIKIQDKSNTTI